MEIVMQQQQKNYNPREENHSFKSKLKLIENQLFQLRTN